MACYLPMPQPTCCPSEPEPIASPATDLDRRGSQARACPGLATMTPASGQGVGEALPGTAGLSRGGGRGELQGAALGPDPHHVLLIPRPLPEDLQRLASMQHPWCGKHDLRVAEG